MLLKTLVVICCIYIAIQFSSAAYVNKSLTSWKLISTGTLGGTLFTDDSVIVSQLSSPNVFRFSLTDGSLKQTFYSGNHSTRYVAQSVYLYDSTSSGGTLELFSIGTANGIYVWDFESGILNRTISYRGDTALAGCALGTYAYILNSGNVLRRYSHFPGQRDSTFYPSISFPLSTINSMVGAKTTLMFRSSTFVTTFDISTQQSCSDSTPFATIAALNSNFFVTAAGRIYNYSMAGFHCGTSTTYLALSSITLFYQVATCPNQSNMLYSAGSDYTVYVWNLATGSQVGVISGIPPTAYPIVSVTAQQNLLYVSGSDNSLTTFSATDYSTGYPDAQSYRFLNDGAQSRIAVSGTDYYYTYSYSLGRLNLSSNSLTLTSYRNNGVNGTCGAIVTSQTAVFTGWSDGSIIVQAFTKIIFKVPNQVSSAINDMQLSVDGSILYAAHDSGTISVWKVMADSPYLSFMSKCLLRTMDLSVLTGMTLDAFTPNTLPANALIVLQNSMLVASGNSVTQFDLSGNFQNTVAISSYNITSICVQDTTLYLNGAAIQWQNPLATWVPLVTPASMDVACSPNWIFFLYQANLLDTYPSVYQIDAVTQAVVYVYQGFSRQMKHVSLDSTNQKLIVSGYSMVVFNIYVPGSPPPSEQPPPNAQPPQTLEQIFTTTTYFNSLLPTTLASIVTPTNGGSGSNLTAALSASKELSFVYVLIIIVVAVLVIAGLVVFVWLRIRSGGCGESEKDNYGYTSERPSEVQSSRPVETMMIDSVSGAATQIQGNSTLINTVNAGLAMPGFLTMRLKVDFELGKLIAEGGGGAIYLGELFRDSKNNPVVVKVIKDCEKEAYELEVAIMGLFRNNSLFAQIFGYDEVGRMIVMRCYPGGSLSSVLGKHYSSTGQGMPKRAVVDVVLDMARAVRFMIEYGLIHNDLKPANLLMRDGLPKGRVGVVLTDFGVAQVIDRTALPSVHQFRARGAGGLSWAYAAPEKWHLIGGRIQRIRDLPATEVYSIGIIMGEVISGILTI